MRLGLGLGLVRLGKAMASFVRDGLKLYYPFKDNSPELLLSGATSFDGSDDYIDLGFSFSETNHTISGWARLNDTSGSKALIDSRDAGTDGIIIYFNSSEAPIYRVNDSTITGSTSHLGEWVHVVGTYDGTTQKLYINGALNQSATVSKTIAVTTSTKIGKNSYTGTNYMDGSIANVGIWNRALSASEIESIYWKGQYADLKGTELTNLVSWYNLKDTVLGSNLVTNGDFATDSNWTKNTGWSIANGLASCNGSQGGASFFYQDIGIVVGRKYKITFDLSNYSAGSVRVRAGSSASSPGVSGYYNANSSVEVELFGSGSGAVFFFEGTTSFTGSIDNVVVKEIQTPDSTETNNGSIYGATTLTDAYSASSPFLPRIQDKATPKGAVALASGSTSFDGSDDYIDFGNDSSLQINGDITITGWIKPTGTTSNRPIVYKRDSGGTNYQFFMDTSNPPKLKFYDGSGEHTSTSALVKDQWNHVAISINSGVSNESIFYINGSLSGVGTNTISGDDANLLIGKHVTDNTFFNGSLANVAIYSDVKTQSQIQDIMFSSYSTLTSALKTNLVSWYDLGSETLSSELVTNGDFSSSEDWDIAGDESTIASGKANIISTTGFDAIRQYNILVSGKSYRIIFDIVSVSSGSIKVGYTAGGGQLGIFNTVATHTVDFVAGGTFIEFARNPTPTNISIDNVSIKELTAEDSQGTNEGTIVGATTNTGYTSSPSGVADPLNYGEVYGGNAVSFDGSSDYISIADSDSLSFGDGSTDSAFTVSAWVKMDDANEFVFINKGTYNSNGEWIFATNNEDKISFWTMDESVASCRIGREFTTAITSYENQWIHLAGTYNGNSSASGFRIYLNGSRIDNGDKVSNASSYVAMENQGADVYVGRYSSIYSNGSIANVQIFNTALTQDQVRELYTKPELTLPTGIASSALKLDMPMQEGSGVAILDGSGNQNHGTGSGITWATGQEYGFQHPLVRSNNPMVFDGSNDRVQTQYSLASLTDFSIQTWCFFDSFGADMGIFGDDNFSTFGIEFETGNSLDILLGGTSNNANAFRDVSYTVTVKKWMHIVLTRSGTSVKLYIDNSLIKSGTMSAIDISGWDKFLIGANRAGGFLNGFVGMINDVAIWDSALTANEVTALYNSGLPLLPTTDSGNYASRDDLVGYWRNDGVTTWTDRSTNSNNGTVSGSPASIIVPEGLNEGRDSQGYYLTDTDSISSGIRLKGAEYISVQDSESLDLGTSDFTLECWLKTTSQGYLRIMDKRDASSGFTLNVNTSEKINLELNDGSGNSGFSGNTAVNDGNWHHVVVSADRSANAKFYLDGALDDTDDISAKNGSLNSVSTLFIGADAPNGDSLFFNGSIDEVRIYKGKALSATEVLKNYNNGKSAHSN